MSIIHCPSSFINHKGFTLVELLVVIAVIAVLMAILLPVLGRVRKQAKSVVCRAHLKQWGRVFALYTEEHEGCFQRNGDNGLDCALSLLRGIHIGNDVDPNTSGRYHSVRTEGIALCPMATRGSGPGTFGGTSGSTGRVWLKGVYGLNFSPWEITEPQPMFRMSYGLNDKVFSPFFESPHPSEIYASDLHVFSLRARDTIPLLFDCVAPSSSLGSERSPPPKEEPSGASGGLIINRHQGCMNGLFFDWSVRSIGLKELWTLKWRLYWNTAGPWTKAGNVQPEDWPKWMQGFKDY